MRAVVQRVTSASVSIDNVVVASIGRGLLILLGIQSGDTAAEGMWLAQKIANLRVFADAEDKMNLSLLDISPSTPSGPTAIVVSQFTLIASTRKGTRPSFNDAASADQAIPLYEYFLENLETSLGRAIGKGQFGASMQVGLVNDGPVTLVIDSRLRE